MPAGILFSFGLFTLICYTYPLHWISLTNSLFQFIKLGWNFIGSWSLLSCLQLMLINLLKMPHHAGIYFSLSLFFLISVFILRIFFFLKMNTLFFFSRWIWVVHNHILPFAPTDNTVKIEAASLCEWVVSSF